jgi:tRNA G37 N-methylase Trm5
MEVLAGEPLFETEVSQHGCRFRLDFSKVCGHNTTGETCVKRNIPACVTMLPVSPLCMLCVLCDFLHMHMPTQAVDMC